METVDNLITYLAKWLNLLTKMANSPTTFARVSCFHTSGQRAYKLEPVTAKKNF